MLLCSNAKSQAVADAANAPTDVDSRTGYVYCQMCDDLIWDPTFEELRIRKMGTASFWGSLSIPRPAAPLSPRVRLHAQC
jgi:hypothetical protein